MGRRAVVWGAFLWLLLAAGCTALDGLSKDYDEVDCFPPGSCADATAEGATGDGASDGAPADRTTGDAPAGDSQAGDRAAGDAPAGDGPAASDGTVEPDAKEDGGEVDATGDGDAAVTANDAGSGGDAVATEAGCPASDLVCDGGCTASSLTNCGACGHDCTNLPHVSGATTCTSGGACSFPLSSCAPGWTHCSANPDQGCETDISSAANCGGCGNVCTTNAPVCAASGASYACVSGCTGSQTLCSGTCVDTTSNANDCKTCGNVCTTSVAHALATCVSSACTYSCNSGYTSCSGACVDETSDDNNCGGCGSAFACPTGGTCTASKCQCPSGDLACGGVCAACSTPANGTPSCSGATCGYTCQTGYSSCASGCWNTTNDSQHCGAGCSPCTRLDSCHTLGTCSGSVCSNPLEPDGTPCGSTNQTCQSGVCMCSTTCNGSCVDLTSDSSNCGTCGHVCPTLSAPSSGSTCQSGMCVGDVGALSGQGTPAVDNMTVYAIEITVPQTASAQSLNFYWTGGVEVPTTFFMGVYATSAGAPTNLIFQGSTTMTDIGLITIPGGSTKLGAGTYWLALSGNFVPNAEVGGTNGGQLCVEASWAYSSSGLPATFPFSKACTFSNESGGDMYPPAFYMVADF